MVKNIKDNLTNIVVILGLIASIGAGFTKFAKMESSIEQLTEASKSLDIVSVDLVESNKQGIDTNSFEITDNRLNINKDQTAIAILKKEIEVLKLEIQELKEASKNPLS